MKKILLIITTLFISCEKREISKNDIISSEKTMGIKFSSSKKDRDDVNNDNLIVKHHFLKLIAWPGLCIVRIIACYLVSRFWPDMFFECICLPIIGWPHKTRHLLPQFVKRQFFFFFIFYLQN